MFIKPIDEISTGNLVEDNKKRIELIKEVQKCSEFTHYLDQIKIYLLEENIAEITKVCKYELFFEEAEVYIDIIFKKVISTIKTYDLSLDFVIFILQKSYIENACDGFLMSWAESLKEALS